jgi:hypothetical protein
MSEYNPVLEAYILEKEKENDEIIGNWAVCLRKHYEAFVAKGFTPKQAMQLIERLWIQVDERQRIKESKA